MKLAKRNCACRACHKPRTTYCPNDLCERCMTKAGRSTEILAWRRIGRPKTRIQHDMMLAALLAMG